MLARGTRQHDLTPGFARLHPVHLLCKQNVQHQLHSLPQFSPLHLLGVSAVHAGDGGGNFWGPVTIVRLGVIRVLQMSRLVEDLIELNGIQCYLKGIF